MTQSQDRLLEIIDLSETGQVQLAISNGQGRQTAPPATFDNPLEDSDRQEIGWYFTEYLQNPFGNAKDRAGSVEARFNALGRALFEAVFQSNEESQACYASALEDGLSNYQLAIVSNAPSS